MAKPKQARLDSFFSPRGQDVPPSTTSIRPMPTEETPSTLAVSTDTSNWIALRTLVRSATRMIMALPSTTIEAERSFSCMKRVKAWLRSTMTSDRLSDLCVLHCHSERINDTEKINRVVTCVAGGKRRMEF